MSRSVAIGRYTDRLGKNVPAPELLTEKIRMNPVYFQMGALAIGSLHTPMCLYARNRPSAGARQSPGVAVRGGCYVLRR